MHAGSKFLASQLFIPFYNDNKVLTRNLPLLKIVVWRLSIIYIYCKCTKPNDYYTSPVADPGKRKGGSNNVKFLEHPRTVPIQFYIHLGCISTNLFTTYVIVSGLELVLPYAPFTREFNPDRIRIESGSVLVQTSKLSKRANCIWVSAHVCKRQACQKSELKRPQCY